MLPSLKDPNEPIDPVQPLRDLVTPEPTYEPAAPPTPPADGRQGTPRVTLRVSSSVSRIGEGVVLIAEVTGDGRAVHGQVAFLADDTVIEQRTLRVQGVASQIELRVVGLTAGTHALRVKYLGNRTFAAVDSAPDRAPRRAEVTEAGPGLPRVSAAARSNRRGWRCGHPAGGSSRTPPARPRRGGCWSRCSR